MRFQRFSIFFLFAAALILGVRTTSAQSGITYPPETETLRGSVQIQGTAVHPDFWKYELAAAPQGTQNWFNIAGAEAPVQNGVLGIWDTRTVPDGPYTIRLRVVRRDGNYDEYFVQNVIGANTAPVETPTPAETPTPTTTPTPKPPTATPVQLTPHIPTPTLAATATPAMAVAAPEEDEHGGDDGATGDKTSKIVGMLGQMKDAFIHGALFVILAFVAVGIFFGVKNLLTWLYVRFLLR
jgi:hypothetical protein